MIWHSSPIDSVLKELNSNADTGIFTGVADELLETYGKNTTANTKHIGLFFKFLSQLKNKTVYLLTAISIITLIVNIIYKTDYFYAPVLVIVIVLINAFISAYHLNKCEQALNDIENSNNPKVQVLRDGKKQLLPSDLLVPGDIIFVNEGDYITADARLINSESLRCNEAILSGDVIPVEKDAHVILEDITVSTARKNMIFTGCSVVHGSATAVVVETGLRTEIGKVTDINRQTKSERLPITETLEHSGKIINVIILIICIVAFFIGLLQNFNSSNFALTTTNALMNAVALGICAIPESLPAISTIVIALGIQRMISDNIIVKNIKAIELLGKTEVFCVDKTGILTKNNMTVDCIYDGNDLTKLSDEPLSEKASSVLQLALSCSMLENDSTEDAIEKTCVHYMSITKNDIGNIYPRLSNIPFDRVRKTMTSINMIGGTPVAIVKGAPEVLLPKCSLQNNEELLKIYNSLTSESYRVLCIALKKLDEIPSNPDAELIEQDLTFVGLIGLYDPPQSDTVEAIESCRVAGIHTIMITGDNIDTAKAIAHRIGILHDESQAISGLELDKLTDEELFEKIENYTVFARITPEHKLRIVSAWQKHGKAVAVTGSGSEDADALSVANVGCAVGTYGTAIAKGNADVIVENKKFMSVVNAIRESRALFENVKKSVSYLLSCNFGEICTFVLGMLIFGMPPLAAVQLLWINLLTDSTSVISLTVEKSEFDVMRKKPLALSGKFFSKGATLNIICDAIAITVLTLIAFAVGGAKFGTSMTFTTLSLVQIFHSYNLKTHDTIFKADLKSNVFMNFTSLLLMFVTVFLVVTPAGLLFGLEILPIGKLLICLLFAILIIPVCEIKKFISRQIAKKYIIA